MAVVKETVLEVEHYTDRLFRIKTTRSPNIKFRDGEFLMIGIDVDGKPLMRAYSVASPNYEDYLEFFSIKVPDGPLTSRLQHIQPGDTLLVNSKAVGTLVMDNLKPGRNLYLMATGTGVAPFMSISRSLDIYDNFERVVLMWGTREVAELAYLDFLQGLNDHEIWGEITQGKFLFYPTVTREDFHTTGRITDAMYTGKIQQQLGLDLFDPVHDRVMICGSNEMNMELRRYFIDELGCTEGNASQRGEFVLEKAFVG
jgi:ferredoxin/flavodoxin---NADP+ reductase